MSRIGVRKYCICKNSIQLEFGSSLETIFQRKRYYFVIIEKNEDKNIYKVYSSAEFGWDLVCNKTMFDKHFVLLKTKISSNIKVNEIPRNL